MKTRILLSAGLAIALAGARCFAAEAVPKFGTANTATYQLTPYDFSPIDSTMDFLQWGFPGGFNLVLATTSPYGAFFGSPHIPSGGRLVGLNVDYCNGNPPGGDDFLVILEDTDASGNFLGSLGTVTAHANDGCTSQSVDLTALNYTVSLSHRLLVWAIFGPNPGAPGPITYLSDVTLTYQLQVSRPPLTPTFGDVPTTDPAYPYVEALAASGITAGCGGGDFCPDQSVTRRQMAVFLSRALGLAYRFGTVETTLYVPEWEFRPASELVQFADTGPPQLSRYLLPGDEGPNPALLTAVDLPAGAVIDEVEFDSCDDRAGSLDPMIFTVWNSAIDGIFVEIHSVPGGGCTSGVAHDVGYTVGDFKPVIELLFQSPFGSQARFQGAKFRYHLQVSPPPATPTFADVPSSDPAFAHVEALAASGITGGCGGGNFCPANPVTRRQMAVFLAKALGLSYN